MEFLLSFSVMRLTILPCSQLLFLALLARAAAYTIYGVESECWKNGSVSYALSAGGEGSAAILKATLKPSYSISMHCRVQLRAPLGSRIMLSLREIDLRTNFDGSCKDFLEVDRPMCTRIVRLDEGHHFESSENVMDVVYHTNADGLDNRTLSGYKGFTLTFTAFQKDRGSEAMNVSDVFHCDNDYWVWNGLTCDGHNNCGDLSDEAAQGNANCGGSGSTVLIILGLLIVLVLVIMCVATLLCSKNDTVRRFSTRLRSRTISFIPRFGSR